jgi:TonB family protein
MTWTRQKWTLVATVIFAGQVAAIFGLHTRVPSLVRLPEIRPTSPDRSTNNPPAALDDLDDPLIFAGAHPRGFSSAAWLVKPRLQVAFSNAISAPTFLSFQRPRPDSAPEPIAPAIETPLPFAPLSISNNAPRESLLLIEGALASRSLRATPAIPLQIAPDVLSPTTVQIGVNPDGFPLSSRILSRSGSQAADIAALQIARAVRFSPGGDSLQWGSLVFQWATTTNSPAK